MLEIGCCQDYQESLPSLRKQEARISRSPRSPNCHSPSESRPPRHPCANYKVSDFLFCFHGYFITSFSVTVGLLFQVIVRFSFLRISFISHSVHFFIIKLVTSHSAIKFFDGTVSSHEMQPSSSQFNTYLLSSSCLKRSNFLSRKSRFTG